MAQGTHIMLMQIREYRPIASFAQAAPVKFQVSPRHLHVDLGQPYTKLAAPLTHVRFEERTVTFDTIAVVDVFGGTGSDLFWQITLKPEDAADLQATIVEVLEAAKTL